MFTLLFLLAAAVPQSSPEIPHPEFIVKCYPEAVMPGDKIYIVVMAKNQHSKPIYIRNGYTPVDGDFKICVKDSENQSQPLLFEGLAIHIDRILSHIAVQPGESRLIGAMSIDVPPLEDLKEPFWEKLWSNFPGNKAELSLCVSFMSSSALSKWNPSAPEEWKGTSQQQISYEMPLVMKPRPEKEMPLIRQWYDNTPNELFPILDSKDNPRRKYSRSSADNPWGIPPPVKILVKGKEIGRNGFVQSRFPGNPNAPETLQGWKELEESISESTMRDEIRLTRILIQYCDTDDDAVLKELKEWFADMNVIQRTVMANSVVNYNPDLVESYEKIHDVINEYVVPVHENYETEFLKQLGLLE